jgi:hypothetical protein
MNTKQKIYFAVLGGVFLVLFVWFIVSVDKKEEQRIAVDALIPRVTANDGAVYKIRVINGCEYLIGVHAITHKGDCTNSIHQH